METLSPASDMNHDQRKALDVWLESASLDNHFETITDRGLCEVLKEEHGIEVGKSTIERWRKKFNWQSYLDLKISCAVVNDEEKLDDIKKSVGIEAAKRTIVDVGRNGELNALAYSILFGELEEIKGKQVSGKRITTDEAKFAKDVAILTSGREDRLMDRAALMGAASKVSREDFLGAITQTVLDIESAIDAEEIEIE